MGMTKTENTVRDGQSAIKVTCGCATHPDAAAILTGRTAAAVGALKGKARDERIHGFVLLANHPARAIQISNARKGIYAA